MECMKRYLKLNDVTAYKKAFALSNQVWDVVATWDYLARDTVGRQFIRAIDSISANIAEGFGRHYKKEKIQFYRYSLGSVIESLDWNEKAKRRNLLSQEQYSQVYEVLQSLPRELHVLINFTNDKLAI